MYMGEFSYLQIHCVEISVVEDQLMEVHRVYLATNFAVINA